MIAIENVSHRLAGKDILSGISLDIPRGGVTALIGPNGAGKSTLLSIVARLEPLQTGRIAVDDLVVGACSNRDLAQKLAILPQSAEVTPRLTVEELVAFGRYPYSRGRPTREDRAKVAETLALFELGALATRPLDTLSGGQRQRAQVALTFAQDTDYMLLDEPLNNLDIAASRALMRLLRDVSDKHGKTIVIVLHDINYASRYADRLVVMKSGQIAAAGAPQEIVTTDMIAEVFETQVRVEAVDGVPWVLV